MAGKPISRGPGWQEGTESPVFWHLLRLRLRSTQAEQEGFSRHVWPYESGAF